MKHLSSEVHTGLILYGASPGIPTYAKSQGNEMIAVHYQYITDHFMNDCRDNDLQVVAWTVDDISDMRKIILQYPDVLICTNHLEALKMVNEEALHRR